MPTRVRRTKAGAANASTQPTPSRFDLEAGGDLGGLPYVLSVDAVKSGAMPELGKSGLPASLEAHVPPELRFWKASDEETARDVRDALVDVGLFKAESLMKIDDEHRLVVQRTFVAPAYEDADVALVKRSDSLMHAASTLVLLADKPVAALRGEPSDLAELDSTTSWILELAASEPAVSPAVVAKLAEDGVRAFELATRPGSLFVTNVKARANAAHVVPFAPVEAKKRSVRLLAKADGDPVAEEERFVLGIVLEPDVVDSQQDTYDAATIRAAAHGFMQFYRNVGLQHQAYVTGKIEILESYLAPVDMVVDGQAIKAGTWLMGLRFVDSKLWAQVKSGELTGLSIGGTAIREPEPNAAELAPA